MRLIKQSLLFVVLFLCPLSYPLIAAILPEDRADISYFTYSGGGVNVDIPAVTLRKKLADVFSFSGTHYVDSISSASIDVVTSASAYKEERTENSLGVDYLSGKNTYTLGFTASEENDYEASTYNVGISHSVFGDLTTINMGYSRGNDDIYRTVKQDGRLVRDESFAREALRQNYRVGVSQILTKDWLMDVAFETVTDSGYLNNPYRQVRYLDADSAKGYSLHNEVYPETRTSHALAFRSLYYLPHRASVSAEYRYYADTWGVVGNTVGIGYTHTLKNEWIFDIGYRYYTQSAADFYRDLFPAANSHTYMARDKELSTMKDHTFSLGVSYEFKPKQFAFIKRGSVNFKYDYILFDYTDFRDLRDTSAAPGEESLYSFSADIVSMSLSLWY